MYHRCLVFGVITVKKTYLSAYLKWYVRKEAKLKNQDFRNANKLFGIANKQSICSTNILIIYVSVSNNI
jgi:hypothetical protein